MLYVQVKSLWPVLHARLDLHLLVAREDHPDVHVAGVGLLLPQEVVHPGLDVVAQPGGLEALRCEPVLLPRTPCCLVATVALEPGDRDKQMKGCKLKWFVSFFSRLQSKLTLSRSARSEERRLGEPCDRSRCTPRTVRPPGCRSSSTWTQTWQCAWTQICQSSSGTWWNLRLWLTWVIPKGNCVPWDVCHALLAKGVLVREQTRCRVPAGWWIS